MQAISASVGRAGRNRPVDVVIVQVLFNANGIATTVDGTFDHALEVKIESYQRDVMGSIKPDAKINKGAKTWNKLNAAKPEAIAAAVAASVLAPIDETTRLAAIDAERFSDLYQKQYSLLSAAKSGGLINLIGFLNHDPDVLDVRWGAYMLATVKHECAETWQPIEEYGKGAGKTYGTAVTVTDAAGVEHSNTYYGRGYVQLTWKENYKKLGEALDMGEDLLIDPAKALEAETAYAIMSYGMRNGSFSTAKRKLSDYISGKTLDYRNARKIINLLDKADLIKGYAETLQILLLLSLNRTRSGQPAGCTLYTTVRL